MDRSIESCLNDWKEGALRYPLLLRGARQVGKTYVVEKFGAAKFDAFEKVNFEAQPEAIACFESLDPYEILGRLETWTKRPIRCGRTLLFLDEIQACPQAIAALRYFKEKMPELHVIGAGSLLEFALIQGKFSFPVGRVQFLHMRPFSFLEFLKGLGDRVDGLSHEEAMQRVKDYFLIGGMPAAVQHFKESRSFLECSRIQEILLSTYRADFGKYATEAEQRYLRIAFDGIPSLVGQQLKYSKIDNQIKSRELKSAIEQLEWAGLVHPIYASSASGIPLKAQVKQNKCKPLFLDIGLLQRSLQVDPELIRTKNLLEINAGALAEQFVGQELLSYSDAFREEKLFFWEREKSGSDAEVDYVLAIDSAIVPLEVKAGKSGHLKSLRQFMEEKKSPLGICLSPNPLSYENKILHVPFYRIADIPSLVKERI
jgi:hypothetical protein